MWEHCSDEYLVVQNDINFELKLIIITLYNYFYIFRDIIQVMLNSLIGKRVPLAIKLNLPNPNVVLSTTKPNWMTALFGCQCTTETQIKTLEETLTKMANTNAKNKVSVTVECLRYNSTPNFLALRLKTSGREIKSVKIGYESGVIEEM